MPGLVRHHEVARDDEGAGLKEPVGDGAALAPRCPGYQRATSDEGICRRHWSSHDTGGDADGSDG